MKEVYNDEKFVEQYYEMIKDYDNTFVIEQFKKFVPKNFTVLELGFGTGIDYLALREQYNITISDYSSAFIKKFKEIHNVDALQLDAKTINITEKFDCIFTNKVLHVFSNVELEQSFINQHRVLNNGGLIFHTFWYDESGVADEYKNNVNKKALNKLLNTKFELVDTVIYSEMETDDSILVVARKI